MAKTPNDGEKKSPPPSSPDLRLVGAAAFAEADAWRGREDPRLAKNDKGVLPELGNLVKILRYDQRWQGVIAYDEFAGRIVKRKLPPFEPSEIGEWMDIDDSRLQFWLDTHYGMLRVRGDVIEKAVLLTGDFNRFHEVREYLRSIKWDGKPRLKYWLHAYLGVPDSPYVQTVSVKWMVGAIARVMRAPRETKMDYVLVLEGVQDAGKSSALKILFDPWFTDAAFEIGSPDGNQIIRGNWGVELAEMDGYNRADSNRSKAFFSRQSDRYRNPYGRKPITVVRQMVFAGSINSTGTYLKDDTGNKRYWPVTVGYVDLDELRADRDQLWAEALVEYERGTIWWLAAGEKSMFVEEQDQRFVGDALEDKIRDWLEQPDDDLGGARRMHVSTRDILTKCMHLEVGKWTPAEQQRVGRIMARTGWPRRRLGSGSREWVYMRPESNEPGSAG
jgi:predicted P-loop ATPase